MRCGPAAEDRTGYRGRCSRHRSPRRPGTDRAHLAVRQANHHSGPGRIADWARKAFDATEAAMTATIEAAIGKAALRQAIDWAYAPSPAASGSHLEWLKTPPQRHAPSND